MDIQTIPLRKLPSVFKKQRHTVEYSRLTISLDYILHYSIHFFQLNFFRTSKMCVNGVRTLYLSCFKNSLVHYLKGFLSKLVFKD